MTLRLITSGLDTRVADFGRPGHRGLGVPVGGAADRWSLAIGNALVGNPPHAPALEFCLAGPTVTADHDIACVVYGAPFALTSGSRRLSPNKTFMLRAGEPLSIGETPARMRAYFCVYGGLQTKRILGSHSSLAPLSAGVELACDTGAIEPRFIHPNWTWDNEPNVLRVVDGPQADWFQPNELFDRNFSVSATSNRMGLRLEGEPLSSAEREMVSEPVCPGSVQVTSDGKCIVLGVDAQTIGGYPKIAQVVSCDLDKLGQLRAGERISFRRVTLDDAERTFLEKQEALQKWVVRLARSRA
jgi:antagonist of KipI